MKSFTVFIAATIVAAASAINEPVASPAAAVERELAEYERQLGTDITGTPTVTPPRPTSGSYYYSYSYGSGKSGKGKSGKGKSSKSSSKGGKSYGWYDSGKSGKSKSGKGSKGSSKGGKSKSAKSTGSYGYSMSMYYLPSCRRKTGLSYDTGSDFLEVDITPLITPESGATFNHFSYFGAADPKDGTCYEGDEPGVMRFTADGSVTPDGTMAECTYKACYEEACDPECCCQNIILIEVTD